MYFRTGVRIPPPPFITSLGGAPLRSPPRCALGAPLGGGSLRPWLAAALAVLFVRSVETLPRPPSLRARHRSAAVPLRAWLQPPGACYYAPGKAPTLAARSGRRSAAVPSGPRLRPQALLIPQLSSFEFHPSTADCAAIITSLGGAPLDSPPRCAGPPTCARKPSGGGRWGAAGTSLQPSRCGTRRLPAIALATAGPAPAALRLASRPSLAAAGAADSTTQFL